MERRARKLKRKCPKELPACSLCLRLDKRCEYPPRVRDSNGGDIRESSTSSRSPITNGEIEIDRHNLQSSGGSQSEELVESPRAANSAHRNIDTFPAIFFLDSEVCTKPLSSDCNPPMTPVALLDNLPPETRGVYVQYFSTIQKWLPILSKKRVRRSMAEFGLAADSPSHLLFLCMNLVSEPLSPGVPARANKTYSRTLEALFKVENSCLPCIQILQSVILLSVYEIGHAIYPAAYLHVGHASRLCVMIGLHDRKNAAQLFKDTNTWTAREEERRAWWAVLCLDRISNQGINGLPFAAPEPSPGELLPCSETTWNEGGVGFNEPIFASSFSNNTTLGSFANVCQAAHVLGRVLRHRDEIHDASLALDFRIAEAKQLHGILASLCSHLREVSRDSLSLDSSVYVALALCFSARLILCDLYACNEKYSTDHGRSSEEAEMQREAMGSIMETVGYVWQLTRQMLDSIEQAGERELDSINPLLCHCLYAAAEESEWFIFEQEESNAGTWLRDFVQLLRVIGRRWQVADVYLAQISKWPGYNKVVM
ncbi:kynurenine 3-monooxygenase, mitochondrial precursor [Hypoxylon texense]